MQKVIMLNNWNLTSFILVFCVMYNNICCEFLCTIYLTIILIIVITKLSIICNINLFVLLYLVCVIELIYKNLNIIKYKIFSYYAQTKLFIMYLNRKMKFDKAILQKINQDTYKLKYIIEGFEYIQILKKNNEKMWDFHMAFDESKNDITELLQQYAGFDQTIFNKKISPQDIGFKKILLIDCELNNLEFENNQTLTNNK